jgi:hypothetical protein
MERSNIDKGHFVVYTNCTHNSGNISAPNFIHIRFQLNFRSRVLQCLRHRYLSFVHYGWTPLNVWSFCLFIRSLLSYNMALQLQSRICWSVSSHPLSICRFQRFYPVSYLHLGLHYFRLRYITCSILHE